MILAGFEGGHKATPYGTVDRNGFVLGFNKPLTLDLCRVMLGNTSLKNAMKAVGSWGQFYFVMQVACIAAFLATSQQATSRLRNIVLAVQFVFLPSAALGALFGYIQLSSFLAGTADGETISDGLPLWLATQPIWLLACGLALCLSNYGQRTRNPKAT